MKFKKSQTARHFTKKVIEANKLMYVRNLDFKRLNLKFFLDALIELLDVHRCGCKKRNETSIG